MLTWRILTLRCWVAFLMVTVGLLIVGAGGEGDDSIHLAKEVEQQAIEEPSPLKVSRNTGLC